MMENPTKIAGTLIELITAVIGLSVFKKAGMEFRLLAFLLLYGFCTDAFCWMFYESFPKQGEFTLSIYSLVESVAFIYIIQMADFLRGFSKSFKWFYLTMSILFIMSYYLLPFMINSEKTFSGFFSFVYLGTASVFAAISILKIIEKEESNFNSPDLLLLMGIFIYCFCSVFIDTFIDNDIKEKIWWVHDIANIIAYLLFTKAFLTINKQTPTQRTT